MTQALDRIGVLGLGTMGRNLALNLRDRGLHVLGLERDSGLAKTADDTGITCAADLDGFLTGLPSPRTILMMITAGAPVDAQIELLRDRLTPGDLLIDGGNSDHRDTARRQAYLAEHSVDYIGLGVSGGELGARHGPAMMAGGSKSAHDRIAPMLRAIAAKTTDGDACVGWFGNGGAGHFVKMMHNGIEYADMQLIAETYFILREGSGLDCADMADLFEDWNDGELRSYLIEITAQILRRQDAETGKPLVEQVLDTAGQKGTGRLSSIAALELGVPAPTLSAAVHARAISAQKDARIAAHLQIGAQIGDENGSLELEADCLWQALWCARLCAYAQGFEVMAAAAVQEGWPLPAAEVARVWRAGCILRAALLDDISSAFEIAEGPTNLLMAPVFTERLLARAPALRRTVAAATSAGLPVPCLASALNYLEAYRRDRLPANLIQAQRDCFGAHGYQRIDRPGDHHSDWADPS